MAIIGQSCRRQVQVPARSSNDAQISFICASVQLRTDMGNAYQSYVFIDNTDSIFPPAEPAINVQTVNQPVFNEIGQYMFPTTAFNQTLTLPWVFYMHLIPGNHSFTLLDTARRFRAINELPLAANMPVSIFYTDSLGYFRSLALSDQFVTQSNQVKLRFVDLSPDAGNIFFTIDEKPAAIQGFDSAYSYCQSSAFVPYANPISDTIRVNFYQAGDSVDVIAREFLQADPGHAYTIALQGYVNTNPQYTDPLTGNHESPAGGLSILAYKNN